MKKLKFSLYTLLSGAEPKCCPFLGDPGSYYREVNGPCQSLLLPFSRFYKPILQPSLLLRPTLFPDRVARIPRTHTAGPLGSLHFMPFTPQATNLFHSFTIFPCVHYLNLLVVHCAILWCPRCQCLSIWALLFISSFSPSFITFLFCCISFFSFIITSPPILPCIILLLSFQNH